eukprot:TRINITY_DN65846_c4_g1_i1.p1 TRINITY_DN65846_c4_g1~~TRINITY_DN65846_c4_g1_i1.p1  ORF type:complete len:620 (-),score=94.12 TRINITY_DN65846_c4_g1_i1:39-1898(-)
MQNELRKHVELLLEDSHLLHDAKLLIQYRISNGVPLERLRCYASVERLFTTSSPLQELKDALRTSSVLQLSPDETVVARKTPFVPSTSDTSQLRTLFVRPFPFAVRASVEEFFGQFGTVVKVRIPYTRNLRNVDEWGSITVEFSSVDVAHSVVELSQSPQGMHYYGCRLAVMTMAEWQKHSVSMSLLKMESLSLADNNTNPNSASLSAAVQEWCSFNSLYGVPGSVLCCDNIIQHQQQQPQVQSTSSSSSSSSSCSSSGSSTVAGGGMESPEHLLRPPFGCSTDDEDCTFQEDVLKEAITQKFGLLLYIDPPLSSSSSVNGSQQPWWGLRFYTAQTAQEVLRAINHDAAAVPGFTFTGVKLLEGVEEQQYWANLLEAKKRHLTSKDTKPVKGGKGCCLVCTYSTNQITHHDEEESSWLNELKEFFQQFGKVENIQQQQQQADCSSALQHTVIVQFTFSYSVRVTLSCLAPTVATIKCGAEKCPAALRQLASHPTAARLSGWDILSGSGEQSYLQSLEQKKSEERRKKFHDHKQAQWEHNRKNGLAKQEQLQSIGWVRPQHVDDMQVSVDLNPPEPVKLKRNMDAEPQETSDCGSHELPPRPTRKFRLATAPPTVEEGPG